MSKKAFPDTINEFVRSQEDLEFQLGDTYDIKASILLVVVIFLAGQSTEFLRQVPPIHPVFHVIQMVSVTTLILSGLLAILELWPRSYSARTKPDQYIGWLKELEDWRKKEQKHPESVVSIRNDEEIEGFLRRFKQNNSINQRKSSLMKWSYYFMMGSVILNLATLGATTYLR